MKVVLLSEDEQQYEFRVSLNDFSYNVTLSKPYYQKLTNGKITPTALVEKSFQFLLERESPEAILASFDIATINHYFPEYEETLQQ